MSLSTFDYVNKLLKVAADALEIQYTKQTPTSLQNWCRDNSGVFVANLGMKPSRTRINSSLDYITYDVILYFVVSRDYDVTEEQKLKQESEARKYANDYVYLLDKNKRCSVQNNDFELIFREGGYLGLGVAGTVNISLPNLDNNCDLFCNTMTVDIEC